MNNQHFFFQTLLSTLALRHSHVWQRSVELAYFCLPEFTTVHSNITRVLHTVVHFGEGQRGTWFDVASCEEAKDCPIQFK